MTISLKTLEYNDVFKRSMLSSAIVLAGSGWAGGALANTDAGAQFDSASDISKVSEWLGKDVQDNEGNGVGEISDFALNLKDGSIAYAVVSLDGMFNDQAIAVPLSTLSASQANDDELTLQVSQSEWQSAKSFAEDDWPLTASLDAGTGMAATGTAVDGSADTITATTSQESGDQQRQRSESESESESESVSSSGGNAEFDTLDADGDGYLTPQEYQVAQGASASDGTDKDQDGRISRSEFAAFEAPARDSGAYSKSSTDDRYSASDAVHSSDSENADDVETDE